jgi:uncharacterized cupredoxin-like copper-binding protein
MRPFGPTRSKVATLAAAAVLLASCGAAATAPQWTFPTGAAPSSGAAASAAASAGETAAASSASTSPASEAPTAGSSAQPIGVPPTGTAVYTSEWSVGVPTTMSTGQVNLAITDIGTIPHEILVFKSDLKPAAYPVDSKGTIIEDGPGITLVSRGPQVDPGKTQTRVVDLTKPGTYLFVCNLPGHFKAGMFRVVTVTPPSAEQSYIAAGLTEWHVAVPTTIKAATVNLEAANFGTIQHEILVFKSDLAPSSFPVDPNGDIVEDGAGINLISDGDNLDPGTTQTRTVDLTQPGSYLFVCNIPGHFKAGMYAVVTVTP